MQTRLFFVWVLWIEHLLKLELRDKLHEQITPCGRFFMKATSKISSFCTEMLEQESFEIFAALEVIWKKYT